MQYVKELGYNFSAGFLGYNLETAGTPPAGEKEKSSRWRGNKKSPPLAGVGGWNQSQIPKTLR
jgi:hypothetical protein